ncbi:MAG TPA: adenosine kinase [Lentisphaeria bacterium]|nr:adenosine kinase [Lentisphaeria bacterium]
MPTMMPELKHAFFPRPADSPRPRQVIGVGSLVVDLIAEVDDAFIDDIGRQKGGMELVDAATLDDILARVPQSPTIAPGGSAANTIHGLARLGVSTAFLGKLGIDDNGKFYSDAFDSAGVDTSRFRRTGDLPTGRCLSLVTPDSERTLCTDLGASGALVPAEVSADDFRDCDYVHIEGYLLFNRDLALAVLRASKEAGAVVGLDLASFEVVGANADVLEDLLRDYVDVVYANEDEAEAFCGVRNPGECLGGLAQHCDVAVLKLGADGARIQADGDVTIVSAQPAVAVDTTGAGDLWAAGFLYGCMQGMDASEAGRCGAVTGSEVVQVLGAVLGDEVWQQIQSTIQE